MTSSRLPSPDSGAEAATTEKALTVEEYDPSSGDYSELESVKEHLRGLGYAWHSFGRRWSRTSDGTLRVWFNGSFVMGTQRLTKQPCGWFTLDQMRREEFADGCR